MCAAVPARGSRGPLVRPTLSSRLVCPVREFLDHRKEEVYGCIKAVSIRSGAYQGTRRSGSNAMPKHGSRPPQGPRGNIHELMAVLADEEPRRILVQLAAAPGDLRELATTVGIPMASVTGHLERLLAVGLARIEGAGDRARYRIGERVTAIAGKKTVYLRMTGSDGAEALITIPLEGDEA